MHVRTSRAPLTLRAASRQARDRWQRSMVFLRLLGDALSWHDDRMALTVFAHIATPQIRLTSDPNTLFFFLDHLHERPPFRLEDDTTWDTNLERGIALGPADPREGRGDSRALAQRRLFVMLSDGETWSGEVAKAIARDRREAFRFTSSESGVSAAVRSRR